LFLKVYASHLVPIENDHRLLQEGSLDLRLGSGLKFDPKCNRYDLRRTHSSTLVHIVKEVSRHSKHKQVGKAGSGQKQLYWFRTNILKHVKIGSRKPWQEAGLLFYQLSK